MKKYFFAVFFLAISALLFSYTWEGVPSGYGLVWSDEFNGAAGSYPNPANWVPETGNNGGWGNNELENYTSSAANAQIVNDAGAVDGKALAITAIDTTPGNTTYSTAGRYTSARLKTQGLQGFQYGYMVARAKMPYGQGIWPAFWMLGTDIGSAGWPACGEIDIMENIGNTADQPVNHGSLHDGLDWSNTFTLPGGQLFHNDYHTFAALWQPGQIQFFVDGNLFETVNSSQQASGTWEFTSTFFFLLNMAVGGNWPGSPDATTSFPQVMYVDYVRAYAAGAPTPVPTVNTIWRVRCGGNDYTDSQGNVWQADTNFTGGLPSAVTNVITGQVLPAAADQTLYQYERFGNATAGATVTYTFNVPQNTNYRVTLKFAEDYWTAPGKRIFNAAINGATVLPNFDIFNDSGGEFVADDKVFDNISSGSAGVITIALSPGSADEPKIDAIELVPENVTPTATPQATFTATGTLTQTCSATKTATATGTVTPSFTLTPSITGTLTAAPYFSFTSTQTAAPLFTNTPSLTAGATGTATTISSCTITQTETITAVFTAAQSETPSFTITPSGTPAQTFTATLTPQTTMTATPGPDLLVYPDPYDPGDNLPMHVLFNCTAGTVSIKLQFWSRGFRLIRQYEAPVSAPDQTRGKIDLNSSIFENFSNGIYYLTAATTDGGSWHTASKIKMFVVLRKK